VGALAAGLLADAFGGSTAIGVIGALTFLSGVLVAAVMRETLKSTSNGGAPVRKQSIEKETA
jgi:hypothetical protein